MRKLLRCPISTIQFNLRRPETCKGPFQLWQQYQYHESRLCLEAKPQDLKDYCQSQKINGSILATFKIVIADFQLEDKAGRPQFFKKTFLVADIKLEMILGMVFLEFSNTNMLFGEETFT